MSTQRTLQYTGTNAHPQCGWTRSATQNDLRALIAAWRSEITHGSSGEQSRNLTVALMRLGIREALERKVNPETLTQMFARALNDEVVATIAGLRGERDALQACLAELKERINAHSPRMAAGPAEVPTAGSPEINTDTIDNAIAEIAAVLPPTAQITLFSCVASGPGNMMLNYGPAPNLLLLAGLIEHVVGDGEAGLFRATPRGIMVDDYCRNQNPIRRACDLDQLAAFARRSLGPDGHAVESIPAPNEIVNLVAHGCVEIHDLRATTAALVITEQGRNLLAKRAAEPSAPISAEEINPENLSEGERAALIYFAANEAVLQMLPLSDINQRLITWGLLEISESMDLAARVRLTAKGQTMALALLSEQREAQPASPEEIAAVMASQDRIVSALENHREKMDGTHMATYKIPMSAEVNALVACGYLGSPEILPGGYFNISLTPEGFARVKELIQAEVDQAF